MSILGYYGVGSIASTDGAPIKTDNRHTADAAADGRGGIVASASEKDRTRGFAERDCALSGGEGSPGANPQNKGKGKGKSKAAAVVPAGGSAAHPQGSKSGGAALMIAGVVLLLASVLVVLAVALPRFPGVDSYAIASGSMEPAMPTGSMTYLSRIDPAQLQEGDIVAFAERVPGGSSTVIIHRVLTNDGAEKVLTTKGDANQDADPFSVPYSNVLGKVTFHVPMLGYVAVWLDTLQGKLILACCIIAGLALCLAGERLRNPRDINDV